MDGAQKSRNLEFLPGVLGQNSASLWLTMTLCKLVPFSCSRWNYSMSQGLHDYGVINPQNSHFRVLIWRAHFSVQNRTSFYVLLMWWGLKMLFTQELKVPTGIKVSYCIHASQRASRDILPRHFSSLLCSIFLLHCPRTLLLCATNTWCMYRVCE